MRLRVAKLGIWSPSLAIGDATTRCFRHIVDMWSVRAFASPVTRDVLSGIVEQVHRCMSHEQDCAHRDGDDHGKQQRVFDDAGSSFVGPASLEPGQNRAVDDSQSSPQHDLPFRRAVVSDGYNGSKVPCDRAEPSEDTERPCRHSIGRSTQ